MLNKGAMFGLDARIALAIFGALSVISGAALYSAIKQAKVVAIVTELTEIQKAYESYMLDVGEQVEKSSSVNYIIKYSDLITSTKTGWKGPYLSYNADLFNANYEYPAKYGNLALRTYTDADWGVDLSAGTQIAPTSCVSGANCKIFIGWHTVDIDLAKSVDEYIDGVSDGQKGKIKLYNVDPTYKHIWFDSGIIYK